MVLGDSRRTLARTSLDRGPDRRSPRGGSANPPPAPDCRACSQDEQLTLISCAQAGGAAA